MQSLYLTRLISSEEKVCIELSNGVLLDNSTILTFDMYTILIETPLRMRECSRTELRQILLYKNHVMSITPEESYVPIIMERFNKERVKGSSE